MYVIPKDLYKHQKNPMTRVVILENQWLEAKVMEADASDDFPDFHWGILTLPKIFRGVV